MINHYNNLRQKYIVDGYEQAYSFIQQLQSRYKLSETLLANFYCYIIIQAQFKQQQILSILQACLSNPDCTKSLRALTLYHTASVHFKQRNFAKCREICQQILREFLGLHYSLEMRLEKSQQEISLGNELQEIIYYVFLMLAYINKRENKINDSIAMFQAGKRIIKDRRDVLSLTSKTTISRDDESAPNTPQYSGKKSSQKYNLQAQKLQVLKHTKSLNI